MTKVSDEFRVDEQGFTADGYRRLDSDALKPMYIRNAIAMAVMAAALVAMYVFWKGAGAWMYVALGAAVAIAVYLVFGPAVFYRRYRYRLTEDRIEIRRGILVIRHTMVPIERVHQVEVTRGPLKRMFGLADVIITTAGGVASIEYVKEDVGESIASRLNEIVVGILKERN